MVPDRLQIISRRCQFIGRDGVTIEYQCGCGECVNILGVIGTPRCVGNVGFSSVWCVAGCVPVARLSLSGLCW